MTRSEIDRRAHREPVPVHYVSEVTYEPGAKHSLRCECRQCERMWKQGEEA